MYTTAVACVFYCVVTCSFARAIRNCLPFRSSHHASKMASSFSRSPSGDFPFGHAIQGMRNSALVNVVSSRFTFFFVLVPNSVDCIFGSTVSSKRNTLCDVSGKLA